MLKRYLMGIFLCLPINAYNKTVINTQVYIPPPTEVKEVLGYKPYKNVLDQKELKCLTDNVYYEAGNEKQEGKIAVAIVTLNRIKHKHFPNTVCDVVYQKVKWKCQFTWVCIKNRKIKYWSNYFQSKKIAEYVMLNYYHINDPTKGATFFHQARMNNPFKNENIIKTVSIGKHVFYKL